MLAADLPRKLPTFLPRKLPNAASLPPAGHTVRGHPRLWEVACGCALRCAAARVCVCLRFHVQAALALPLDSADGAAGAASASPPVKSRAPAPAAGGVSAAELTELRAFKASTQKQLAEESPARPIANITP